MWEGLTICDLFYVWTRFLILIGVFCLFLATFSWKRIKHYYLKVHIFWEGHKIFTLLLSYVVPVKSKVKISKNFVAFSEYMNFSMLSLALAWPCRKSDWSLFQDKYVSIIWIADNFQNNFCTVLCVWNFF